MKTQLLRINHIAGQHYSNRRSENLIIYGIGAPIVPDSGQLPDAKYLMQHDVDLFVPDYIGYGRSDGIFTPQGCIETFLHLFYAFSKGCIGKNYYEKKAVHLQYKRIIVIGRSLGGTYVPLLPRYNPKIKELAVFCPVVDSQSCGSKAGEETNEQFLNSMKHDGYHHLYRGVLEDVWKRHLENKDDLSPMDNITHLKAARLFIAHGKLDRCVHFSKSQIYFDKILKILPGRENQFKLNIYQQGAHDSTTTNVASIDFMQWLQIPKHYEQ